MLMVGKTSVCNDDDALIRSMKHPQVPRIFQRSAWTLYLRHRAVFGSHNQHPFALVCHFPCLGSRPEFVLNESHTWIIEFRYLICLLRVLTDLTNFNAAIWILFCRRYSSESIRPVLQLA